MAGCVCDRIIGGSWNVHILKVKGKGKGKAIPLQAWTGLQGSRSLRYLDVRPSAHEGGKFVSPTHRPPFTPRRYSWYAFVLEAESTPGP
jgi:hypothetical protein